MSGEEGGQPQQTQLKGVTNDGAWSGSVSSSTEEELNPQFYQATDPLVNELTAMRAAVNSIPEIWLRLTDILPNQQRAILDEHLCDDMVDLTFSGMAKMVQCSAAVFCSFGVTKGMHVAILGENSARWLQVDHGLQLAGGVSAVHGADATMDELHYIYEHSDSAGIVVLQGPKLLQALLKDASTAAASSSTTTAPLGLYNEKYGPVKQVILLNREKKSNAFI